MGDGMTNTGFASDARYRPARAGGVVLGPAMTLALIGYGASFALLLALAGSPHSLRFDPPLIAHVAGMLAGYGVAVMLVLMARTPALERGVGADVLARW